MERQTGILGPGEVALAPRAPRPGWGGFSALLITSVVTGAIGLLLAAWTTFPDALDETSVQFATAGSPALASRMIVVILGSLRRDAAEDVSLMPRLAAARRRGSGGIAQTAPIPISASFTRALTAGRPFSPLDVFRDFYPFQAPAGSAIHQAVSAGLRVCLVGPSHLVSPFVGVAQVALDVPFTSLRDLTTQDDETFRRSMALIRARACDLLTLYLGGMDYAGHTFGGMSPAYQEMARRLDGMLGVIEDATDPSTTFLVISDHGTNDVGDHATAAEAIVRDAPFVIWGRGAAPGLSLSMRQIDLAPLLAGILGFPIPPGAVGTVPMDLLNGPPSIRAQILARALVQKTQYLEAYGRRQRRRLPLGEGDLAAARAPAGMAGNAAAERAAVARLHAADALYWRDLLSRAWQRTALGGSAGGVLLALLGILLGSPATPDKGATLWAGPTSAWRTAVAATLVGLIGLAPLTLPEGGTAVGSLVLLIPWLLGVSAISLWNARALISSPVWSGALLLWGMAFGLLVWAPQLHVSVDLPPFRPGVLARHPLMVGLSIAGLGAVTALGLHTWRNRPGPHRPHAVVPFIALTFLLFPGSFHDVVHWGLAVGAGTGLWFLVGLKRPTPGPIVAATGLLAILAVRRVRGLILTWGLGESRWVLLLSLAAASALVLAWTHRLRKGEPASDRGGTAVAGIGGAGALLAWLAVAGAVRWWDLQTVSRWLHPATLAVIAMASLTTRGARARLPMAMGGLLASSCLLFDPYGFLELMIAVGVLMGLWPSLLRLPGEWRPVAAGLLSFGVSWLLFFGTGNEFDLTAINSLRKGLLGSDVGGAEGFSLGWTIVLIAFKFSLVHLLPPLTLVAEVSRRRTDLGWPAFMATGSTLHFALLVAAFVHLQTIGYSAAGGILLAGMSCIVFLLCLPVRHWAEGERMAGPSAGRLVPAYPPARTQGSLETGS